MLVFLHVIFVFSCSCRNVSVLQEFLFCKFACICVRNVICEIEWGLVKMFCVFGTELDGCLKGKYANFQLWINVIHFKILSKFGKLWHVLEVAHDSCRLDWSRPVFRHSSYPVYAAVMILRWKFRTAEIACKQVRYFRIMTVASIRFWRALCWFFFFFFYLIKYRYI